MRRRDPAALASPLRDQGLRRSRGEAGGLFLLRGCTGAFVTR